MKIPFNQYKELIEFIGDVPGFDNIPTHARVSWNTVMSVVELIERAKWVNNSSLNTWEPAPFSLHITGESATVVVDHGVEPEIQIFKKHYWGEFMENIINAELEFIRWYKQNLSRSSDSLQVSQNNQNN